MYSRMKRKCSFMVLVVMVVSLTDKWIKQTSTLKYYRNTTSNRKKHMKM